MASTTQWAIIAAFAIIVGLGTSSISQPAHLIGAIIGAGLVASYVVALYNGDVGPNFSDSDEATN